MSNVEKNLVYIRQSAPAGSEQLGARLFETFDALQKQIANLQAQVNGNTSGQPAAPPQIGGLQVQAQNGHFQISITDNNPIYRGIQYFVEHANNPQFQNSHTIKLGDSRNHNEFLGNVTRYWRAYSSYGSTAASAPVYHGGSQPKSVTGGGTVGGPNFLASQGSGTGQPDQGLQGPGSVPFRGTNPPVRS